MCARAALAVGFFSQHLCVPAMRVHLHKLQRTFCRHGADCVSPAASETHSEEAASNTVLTLLFAACALMSAVALFVASLQRWQQQVCC